MNNEKEDNSNPMEKLENILKKEQEELDKIMNESFIQELKFLNQIFIDFNSYDLTSTNNSDLMEMGIEIGKSFGILKSYEDVCSNVTSYKLMINRLGYLKKKLCVEAKRRDGFEDWG